MSYKRLLLYFPQNWLAYRENEEQVLYGGWERPFDDVKVTTGGISDPTGNKAVALAALHDQLNRLNVVRQWIDHRLPPGDRRLLISVWRYHEFGWLTTARNTGLGVSECKRRWNRLTTDLENHTRKVFAGRVCV